MVPEQFKDIRTPFYYYDMDVLDATIREIKACIQPSFKVHYAVKANFEPEILRTIARAGFGADCVSGGEVRAAYQAGFKAENIVFAGVGKSDHELQYALSIGIGRFNVESSAELEVIDELAAASGTVAPVSLRVNPDLAAHTIANIATGRKEDKFGIDWEMLPDVIRLAQRLEHVDFKGLHFHIGSQILDMTDFGKLCSRVNEISEWLVGQGLPVGDINVGGGLGVDYEDPDSHPVPDFKSYFDVFRQGLRTDGTVSFELGRSIVAQCGSLISRVLYVKEGSTKRFAIIDGSMTELIRPALYHARHLIQNISSDGPLGRYDVVGPVCESSDIFGTDVELPECRRGDLVAIRTAGAYGRSMSSTYNCRPLPSAVFSN